MHNHLFSSASSPYPRLFIASFLGYVLTITGLTFILTGTIRSGWQRTLYEAFFFASVMTFYEQRFRGYLTGTAVFLLLYELPLILLCLNPLSCIPARSVSIAAGMGLSLWTMSFLLQSLSRQDTGRKRLFLSVLGSILFCLTGLLPLPELFYHLVSGGNPLTADILLTLFQTNTEEALSYVRSQSGLLWTAAVAALAAVIYSLTRLGKSLKHSQDPRLSQRQRMIAILLLWVSFLFPATSKRFTLFSSLKETRLALAEYKHYGSEKEKRMQRLSQLRNLSIRPEAKGVYVLVIGESATRDHMHAYGYERETTPFLDRFRKMRGTVLFRAAYSNHVHTVPALSYALSEKNQYNDLPLENAYSLVEIAKAAGYKTYWISNQRKYSAWDTPITEIASTADYQVWLNGRAGEGLETTFYDEALLERIPHLTAGQPALLIFHIMGSHGAYKDRYPTSFAHFHGPVKRVDEYDNSIAYTDHFLETLFKKASGMDNFQGLVYMPDHGEDPDTGKYHEATKYLPVMSRIPFVVHMSPVFMAARPNLAETIASHSRENWTNDLLYNFMVSFMGIKNAPSVEYQYDLCLPSYHLQPEEVRLLHGKRKLKN